jgi:hypothetical protein
MNLSDFIVQTRILLKDIGLKSLPDPALVRMANEAKNDLYRMMRVTLQDYFLTSATVGVSCSAPPDANSIALPADFSQLKDIMCTSLVPLSGTVSTTIPNPTAIEFLQWDRHDIVFRHNLRNTFSGTTGIGQVFYYDIQGISSLQFVPPIGSTGSTMTVQIYYVAVPPDLTILTDSPSTIPIEYHDYILTYMVCECMRAGNDPRVATYTEKLTAQVGKIAAALKARALNEPQERG